jgi:uncharacterized membrane protein YdbT with pleckstrin-like domain
MEKMIEKQPQATDDLKVFHPSAFHYLGFFVGPLVLLGVLFLWADVFYFLIGVWVFEILLAPLCWVRLVTTTYFIKTDRIEIQTGILVKQTRNVPYDQIVNITCDQTLFQKPFHIGNIFIDTPGGKSFELALLGIENHQEIADLLFALKKGGTV